MAHRPRPLLVALLLVPLALACSPELEDACGLPAAVPTTDEVPDGYVRATLDGQPFEATGTWSDGPSASIDADGPLSMIIAKDQTATSTIELVGRGAFPICVPLGERSDTSGNATWDSSFVTDKDHTGMVAILGEDAGFLLGRFEVELVDANNGAVTKFEDGVFRAQRR